MCQSDDSVSAATIWLHQTIVMHGKGARGARNSGARRIDPPARGARCARCWTVQRMSWSAVLLPLSLSASPSPFFLRAISSSKRTGYQARRRRRETIKGSHFTRAAAPPCVPHNRPRGERERGRAGQRWPRYDAPPRLTFIGLREIGQEVGVHAQGTRRWCGGEERRRRAAPKGGAHRQRRIRRADGQKGEGRHEKVCCRP